MAEPDRTVHIVDDDEAVRRSVGFMLRGIGYQVRTYASGDALLAAADSLAPGCVLLDLRMPGSDGFAVQQQLRTRGILHPVIVMTGHGDAATAVRAMKNGAIDFIEKPFEKALLVAMVEEAFALLGRAGRRSSRAEQARARLATLTGREREVLEGMVRGHPNKTIGFDLGISPRTVEIHRAHLMIKLEVSNLSEALRVAFAAGVGEDEEGEG